MTFKRCSLAIALSMLALALQFSGCDSQTSVQDGEVRIRVENGSTFEMGNVRVFYPDREVSYGNLDPGQASEYRTVTRAYRYQGVEAMVDGKIAGNQPVDFVGEDFLEEGSYTYELNINNEVFESRPDLSVYIRLRRD